MFTYLTLLPKDISFFIEVRQPEWFSYKAVGEDYFSMLKRLKLGAVITNAAGCRDCAYMHFTVPKTFIRYVGNSLHKTDYKRIDE